MNPYPLIRDVCCLAVSREAFLHSTSLLQGKCWAMIMLDNVGQPCDSIRGDSACVLLGSERVNESVLHSTSLLQGKVGDLKCLTM